MADNIAVTPGTGATIAADDIGGVLVQRVKATWGVDGTATDVSAANPLPVAVGIVPVTGTFFQATQPVSLASTPGLTDTQLRAAAVPVSGPLTDTQIRAAALPVSGPVTDTQLRASAVPVSLATAPALVAGSAIVGKVGIDQTTPGTTNKVSIGTDGTVAINAAIPAGANNIGAAFQAVSATQATATVARLASAASTNATSVKASAGMLYRVTAANTNAAARYLKFYNKASAPTVGTDTPLVTIFLPAGGGFSEEFDIPIPFTTGIAYAMTTGVADSDTAAVSLNDIQGLILYA